MPHRISRFAGWLIVLALAVASAAAEGQRTVAEHREIRLPGRVAMSLPPTGLERDAAEKLASNAAPEVVVIDTRQ